MVGCECTESKECGGDGETVDGHYTLNAHGINKDCRRYYSSHVLTMAPKRFATISLTNVLLLLCDYILKCFNADARYIGVSGAVKLRNGTHQEPARRYELR